MQDRWCCAVGQVDLLKSGMAALLRGMQGFLQIQCEQHNVRQMTAEVCHEQCVLYIQRSVAFSNVSLPCI